MIDNPQTDRVTAIYDAIDGFQRTHRLPGLQHAQLRGLLAEHLARTLPAVVSSPPATDRATLRERIRRAVCEAEGFAWDSDMLEPDEHGDHADLVLAVLPAPVDRGAVLREAADAVFALDYDVMVGEEGDENLGSMREAWDLGTIHAMKLLRRVADEAQQPDVQDGEAEKLAKARRMAKAFNAPPVAPPEWAATTEWPGRHKRAGDRRVHATASFPVNRVQQIWTACGERVGEGGYPLSHMSVDCRACRDATAVEARQQPDTETRDDDVVERRETVLYCIQTQQPDGSWADSSSVLSSPEHAAGPLAERRKYWPQFEHRIVQHVTTVVVQLMDEQPAAAPAVVSQPEET